MVVSIDLKSIFIYICIKIFSRGVANFQDFEIESDENVGRKKGKKKPAAKKTKGKRGAKKDSDDDDDEEEEVEEPQKKQRAPKKAAPRKNTGKAAGSLCYI